MKKFLVGALALFVSVTGICGERKIFDYSKVSFVDDALYDKASKKPLTGTYYKYYDSGELESIVSFKNGRLHGPAEQYFPSGYLQVEEKYKDGKHVGDCKFYFESGRLHFNMPYKNGVKHGLQNVYHKNGNLERSFQLVDGKLNGAYKIFYKSGPIHKDMTFEQGKVVSGFIFSEDGETKREMTKAHLLKINDGGDIE